MTDVKITQLPVASSTASPDKYVLVQSGVTKQIDYTNLFTNVSLVTPNLGTPTAGVLSSCTGLPISSGVSGLASGMATFLATPTSSNLRSTVTDETGSGALVFANSPSLVTPVLGTPSSGDLTNCTGSPTFSNLKTSGYFASSVTAPTIASATSIAVTAPFVFVSGTATIDTIVAPSPISTGSGQITIIPTDLFTLSTAGNIALGVTAVVNRAIILTYDSGTTKWYPSYT